MIDENARLKGEKGRPKIKPSRLEPEILGQPEEENHCHVTQPLLLEQLREWDIDISAGQLNRLLVEDKESYHAEKQNILRVGLKVSSYINTDDTSARHQGVNS